MTAKKSRVTSFIEEDTALRQKRSCRACRTAEHHPGIDSDIREWITAYNAGEAGSSTWTSFVEWLKKEHGVAHGRVLLARHAVECLNLPCPVKSYG